MNGELLNNRYKINEIIGTGGMSIVYDGYDTLLSRKVAIKVLKDSYIDGDDFIDRLKKEASASAAIIDDNIVSIYDIGRHVFNGKMIEYIVMEKIDGKTLKDIIQEEAPLSNEKILNYAQQIAKALQTAHMHGLIHRDIKPANILVTKDDKIKVTDFGIARVSTEATITYTSSILGTVHYISPEQAKGLQIDNSSDLYSLGVVLFEMATGKVPFDADSPVSIAIKHIQDQAPSVTELNSNIDVQLSRIIDKLLSKKPVDRYKTASNLLTDINKLIAGKEIKIEKKEISETPSIGDTVKTKVVYKSKDTSNEIVKDNKTKKKWPIIVGGIFLLFIFILGFKFLLDSFINKKQELNRVVIPSVLDLKEEVAIEKLQKLGIHVSIKSRVYDDKIIAGNIVDQSIEPGSKIKKENSIELTVSKGKKLLKVPRITGFTLNSITNIVKDYGFVIGEKTTEESDSPKGTIIKQLPEANELVESGTKIDIVLSSGPKDKKVIVPNVEGLEQSAAINTLRNSGLVVNKILLESSDNVLKNEVLSQSIEPGKEVKEGTKIDITISSGPDRTDENKDVNLVEYKFNINVPTILEGDKFNVKIINTLDNSEVYNDDLNVKDANKDGIIELKIKAPENAKFKIYYNDKEVSVKYE